MSPRRIKRPRYAQGHVVDVKPAFFGGLKLAQLSHGHGLKAASVVHVTLPRRYRHEPLYHKRTHEWLYVLRGRTTVSVDGKTRKLGPGSFAYIAPGVPHQMGAEKERVEVLVVFSPPMRLDAPDIVMARRRSRK